MLGIPCVTLRENTERPVTITDGTNILAGTKKENIVSAARASLKRLEDRDYRAAVPPLWDGKAAKRIIDVLASV